MTCIVALKHSSGVTVGADRNVSSGSYFNDTLAYPKIFKTPNLVIGVSGNLQGNNLLKYVLLPTLPKIGIMEPLEYLVTVFLPNWQKVLREHGYTREQSDNGICDIVMLVVVKNRLFRICDFAVTEYQEDYLVIGSGRDFAYGSLRTTDGFEEAFGISAHSRVMMALEAASKFVPDVNGPFDFIEVSK